MKIQEIEAFVMYVAGLRATTTGVLSDLHEVELHLSDEEKASVHALRRVLTTVEMDLDSEYLANRSVARSVLARNCALLLSGARAIADLLGSESAPKALEKELVALADAYTAGIHGLMERYRGINRWRIRRLAAKVRGLTSSGKGRLGTSLRDVERLLVKDFPGGGLAFAKTPGA